VIETLQATLPLARGADVVVASGQHFLGASVAEKFQVPYWYVALSPVAIKSAHYPPVLSAQLGLPRWSNRTTWLASERAADSAFRAALNTARATVGLEAVRGVLAHTIHGPHSRLVAAFSGHLFPGASDWPRGTIQPGAFSLEGGEGDPTLAAWLAEGPPPVYVGFGSMGEREPLELLRMCLAAGRAADVRLVLGGEWGSLGKGSGPNVYFARDVDHGWLFPRVAALVHHGGAGTSAAAIRAGRPSVVVPHIGDQFLWARRLHQQGAAIAPIPRPLLTADTLTRALTEVLSEELKVRAAALGELTRSEGGASAAAAVIAAS
jgi:UDP:flavonoid glycosyltransferase YjiC (YdhE family)